MEKTLFFLFLPGFFTAVIARLFYYKWQAWVVHGLAALATLVALVLITLQQGFLPVFSAGMQLLFISLVAIYTGPLWWEILCDILGIKRTRKKEVVVVLLSSAIVYFSFFYPGLSIMMLSILLMLYHYYLNRRS